MVASTPSLSLAEAHCRRRAERGVRDALIVDPGARTADVLEVPFPQPSVAVRHAGVKRSDCPDDVVVAATTDPQHPAAVEGCRFAVRGNEIRVGTCESSQFGCHGLRVLALPAGSDCGDGRGHVGSRSAPCFVDRRSAGPKSSSKSGPLPGFHSESGVRSRIFVDGRTRSTIKTDHAEEQPKDRPRIGHRDGHCRQRQKWIVKAPEDAGRGTSPSGRASQRAVGLARPSQVRGAPHSPPCISRGAMKAYLAEGRRNQRWQCLGHHFAFAQRDDIFDSYRENPCVGNLCSTSAHFSQETFQHSTAALLPADPWQDNRPRSAACFPEVVRQVIQSHEARRRARHNHLAVVYSLRENALHANALEPPGGYRRVRACRHHISLRRRCLRTLRPMDCAPSPRGRHISLDDRGTRRRSRHFRPQWPFGRTVGIRCAMHRNHT